MLQDYWNDYWRKPIDATGFRPKVSKESMNCHEDIWQDIKYDLTVRTLHGIENLGIDSIEEFLALDKETFLGVRAIGRTCWEEVRNVQKKLLIKFGVVEVKKELAAENKDDQPVPEEAQRKWNRIRDRLTVRTENGLKKLSIDNLNDFLSLTREQFLSVRSMGNTSWREVAEYQEQLAEYRRPEPVKENEEGKYSEQQEAELLKLVANYLGRRSYIIKALNIKSFSEICNLKYEELSSLDHIGKVAWKKLQGAINKAELHLSPPNKITDLESLTFTDLLFFGGYNVGIENIPPAFFPEISTELLNLSPRNKAILKKLRIRTIGALLLTDPGHLLKQANFGESSLDSLRTSLREYIDYLSAESKISIDMMSSLDEFISHLCKLSCQSSKKISMFLTRIGTHESPPQTLAEIANKFGYTRERIRQIIRKVPERIHDNFRSKRVLDKFQDVIVGILSSHRGVISFEELGIEISRSLGWDTPVSGISLSNFCKLTLNSSEITIQKNSLICVHPCRDCSLIGDRLSQLVEKESKGRVSLEALSEDEGVCVPISSDKCPGGNCHKYSVAFISDLCKKNNLECDGEYIYSSNTWHIFHSGVNRKVDAVLDMRGEVSTPKEVAEELNLLLDIQFPIRKIHSALINSENTCVWGRGEFIHCRQISCSDEILDTIKKILSLKFNETHFIALHGIFNEFRFTFENGGIPNEYALSSVIDKFIDEFHVDRYRYVYESKPESAMSIDRYFEKWLLEQNDTVKIKDFRSNMRELLGVRSSLATLALQRIDSIVHINKYEIIHIDNLRVSKKDLKPISDSVTRDLLNNDQIGVIGLFDNNKIKCLQLGIESPMMLHSIMRFYFSDQFYFNRYPHISLTGENTQSMHASLSSYVESKNQVVSIDECVSYFETLGYDANRMRGKIKYVDSLLQYYTGCLIHEETIEWCINKETELLEILRKAFFERVYSGYVLGDLEDVYDSFEDDLPNLANDIGWTGELLYSLASRMNDLVFLGNAKRAYTISSGEKSTQSLGELVGYVVRDVFAGGCSRDQLDEWMVDNGVVRNKLTSRMFTAPEGLVMTDYECTWRED